MDILRFLDYELSNIEVINILTCPGYFACRLVNSEEDKNMEISNSEYVELEQMLHAEWLHRNSTGFGHLPNSGTLVMATDENKRSYKRGVIIKVEGTFDHGNIYYVYLFDWGYIKGYSINQLAKLKHYHLDALPPRTFLLILAGVVCFNEKWERFRVQRLKIEETKRERMEQCFEDKEQENCVFIRHWLKTHPIVKMKSFKKFFDVIYYGELYGMRPKKKQKENVPVQYNSTNLSEEMEKQGLSVLSAKYSELESNTEKHVRDLDHLRCRLESINCTELCERMGRPYHKFEKRLKRRIAMERLQRLKI